MTFRAWLLNTVHPIVRWWGRLHFPFTHKMVTGTDYYAGWPSFRPGTIFLTRTRGEFSAALIPGFWTHGAIYTPDPAQKIDELVTEAVGVGVRREDLITFMTTKDYLVALEPKFLGANKDAIMARAAALATEQIGKPYDYDFEFQISDQKAFYCSELVWWSYDRACAEAGVTSPFVPRKTMGEPTVTPNDIFSATSKFAVVWHSESCQGVPRALRPVADKPLSAAPSPTS
jgi:uncharacterized protein YycO